MKTQTSKALLLAVMLTYFVGLGVGIYFIGLILREYPEHAVQALIALFGYIGTPVGVTIGFYSWKAKNENVAKINLSEVENENEV